MFDVQVSKSAAVLCALILFPPAAKAGGVRIASPAGGPSYSTLGAAVAAASDGDVLLVGEGTYVEPFVTIQGKSLTVMAVGDPAATLLPPIVVENVPADGRVHLRGLTIQDGGLSLQDSPGAVHVEDCRVFSWKYPITMTCELGGMGGAGVVVDGAWSASFVNCLFVGGQGEDVFGGCISTWPTAGQGGPGLVVYSGEIALYGCVIEGGKAGKTFGTAAGGKGGNGLVVQTGVAPPGVFAAGCTFRGGNGTSAGSWSGTAVSAFGDFTYLDCTFSAQNPPPGGLIQGSAVELDGRNRPWNAPALVLAGAPFQATLAGVPGDALWVLRSMVWALDFALELKGVLHVKWPQHLPTTPLGVVPASGALQVMLPGVRALAGQSTGLLATQGFVRPALGTALLSGPQLVIGLDPLVGPDCDANGVSDYVDVVLGGVPDANHNLIPDSCPGG